MTLFVNYLGSASADPEFTTLTAGQVAKANDSGQLIYGGATVDETSGEWTFDQSINIPQASLKISDVVSISEATFTPYFRDNILNTGSVNAVAVIDSTGTGPLVLLSTAIEQTLIAQPDFSVESNTSPFIAPLQATFTNQTNAVVIKTGAAMSNVRMTITDDVTGVVVKYIPNKTAVSSGVGGLDLKLGDNRVDFNSSADDDPVNGLFYIGNTPLRQYAGEASTFKIEADSISILGNSSGIPYFENEIQFIQPKVVPGLAEISHVADNFTRLNSSYTEVTATTGGIAITSKSTGLSDAVTAGQFDSGVDSTSNPTVLTDGSGTFSQNDIVQISGSSFNDSYVEVQSHVGNLLTIKGVGLIDTVESFCDRNFTSSLENAALTKIEVVVVRASETGRAEQATGSVTPLVYSEIYDPKSKAVVMDAYLSTDLIYDTNAEEKIIEFDTISKSNSINLGSGGEIEIVEAGRYDGHLILQINENSDPTVVVWTEVKPVLTGTWALSGGMAKTKFKEDASWTLTVGGSLELQAGDKVRIKAMMLGGGSDKITLEGITQAVGLGTLVQPSAHIEILRVGALTV